MFSLVIFLPMRTTRSSQPVEASQLGSAGHPVFADLSLNPKGHKEIRNKKKQENKNKRSKQLIPSFETITHIF